MNNRVIHTLILDQFTFFSVSVLFERVHQATIFFAPDC